MNFEELIEKANKAGHQAVEKLQVVPMIVGEPTELFGNDIDYDKPTYFVADGVCGFAQVRFKGNTSFGKFMKASGKARTDSYYGGLFLSVHFYNQSLQKKEAYAKAYVKVLQEGGISDAYMTSRMD